MRGGEARPALRRIQGRWVSGWKEMEDMGRREMNKRMYPRNIEDKLEQKISYLERHFFYFFYFLRCSWLLPWSGDNVGAVGMFGRGYVTPEDLEWFVRMSRLLMQRTLFCNTHWNNAGIKEVRKSILGDVGKGFLGLRRWLEICRGGSVPLCLKYRIKLKGFSYKTFVRFIWSLKIYVIREPSQSVCSGSSSFNLSNRKKRLRPLSTCSSCSSFLIHLQWHWNLR